MSGPVTRLILAAARPYVAGETLDDALRVATEARARGHGVTLSYWHDEDDPVAAVVARQLAGIEALRISGADAHLALKVPGLRADPGALAEVIAAARGAAIPVVIDAHGPEAAATDLRVAERFGPQGLGIAIPGRWLRSTELADAATAMGLRVRVIKGQWPDPDAPGLDMAEGFMAVVERLAGRARDVGIATHDPALVARAIARLQETATPVEQELLYGLPMPKAAAVARRAGVATRVYIPYGSAWIPYSLRRALGSPRTFLRFGRDLVTARRDGLPPTTAPRIRPARRVDRQR